MNIFKFLFKFILGSVIFIVVLFLLYLLADRWRATRIASDYLDNKYEQEMKQFYATQPFADPAHYTVWYYPVGNSDIRFQVELDSNQELCQRDEPASSADNYYIANFEYRMNKELLPDLQNIWEDLIRVNTFFHDPSYYGFTVPPELNDSLSLKEMEDVICQYEDKAIYEYKLENETIDKYEFRYELPYYNIIIYANDKGTKEEIAAKILETFQLIKKKGFRPRYVVYAKEPSIFSDRNVYFKKWMKIEDVGGIIKRL